MKYILILSCFLVLFAGCSTSLVTNEINTTDLLEQHNQIRANSRLKPLIIDNELQEKAQNWAETMAKKNRLRHGSITHSRFNFLGENIAWGQSNVDSVLQSWMESTGHKKNILNKGFTHVGFGTARRENGSLYWCTQFGGK